MSYTLSTTGAFVITGLWMLFIFAFLEWSAYLDGGPTLTFKIIDRLARSNE